MSDALNALGPGREFALIRAMLGDAKTTSSSVKLGVGDDAALLNIPDLVASIDLSIEGVHFRREWLTAEEIGYRAAMAAFSDLAAMGASGEALLQSVAVANDDIAMAEGIGAGTRRAAELVGATVVGGDTSRSPGPIIIDCAVLGSAPRPLRRSGAKPGDFLCVTGPLGGAATWVRAMMNGEAPNQALRRHYAAPTARITEGRRLASSGATAAIDISDGLMADAAHLARASGVRVVIAANQVPRPEGVDLTLALSGGEDYELLVAIPESLLVQLSIQGLSVIGRCEAGEGVGLVGADQPAHLGHDHFGGQE